MARAISSDFLQAYRFTVEFLKGTDSVYDGQSGFVNDKPVYAENTEAAFNTVTVPEVTLENVEYNEGMRNNRYKQPGLPTYSDLTLTRGVIRTDSRMFEWAKQVLDGLDYGLAVNSVYRADIKINHHDRLGQVARSYIVYNAFPIRVKLAADFDATSSEISIAEMDVAYEAVELVVNINGSEKSITLSETS